MMNGYYMVADNAASLSRVFTTIVESMTTTTASINLDAESVLRDVISDDFILPDDFSVEQNVTVETSAYQGSGNGAAPVAFADAVVARNGNTIDVTNYTAEGNLVILSGNQGKKIIVTITGVEAKDSAVTGELVDTNTPDSGIWDKADGDQLVQVDKFEVPSVAINKKSFVLDYAKEATLELASTVMHWVAL